MNVNFKRTLHGDWEPWLEVMTPKPPTPADAPFKPCGHGHEMCMEFRGVHMYAVRFADGRVYNAWRGWT